MSHRSAGAIRFRPPRVVAPPAVRWMLQRAFGPLDAPFLEPLDPEAALAAARRFETSARLAARQGARRLAAELGPAATALQRDRAAATALGLRLSAVAGEVATAAAPLGIPLVFLKFAALTATGVSAPGARAACDVDVLVPAAAAPELQRALLARGWRPSGMPEGEHQLPALVHARGGVVEVHRLLLGVRLAGGGSATAGELARRGLLEPLPELPGDCAVPSREVQAAHTLVHGLGQHGWWPGSYPLLRMVADLIDLGIGMGGIGGIGGKGRAALAAAAAALVARDVTAGEAAAAAALCAALAAGDDLLADPGDPRGEAVLLRHILAGRLDPDYAAALRLGLFRAQPSDRPPAWRLARLMLGAVFLSRAQVDAIYGVPRQPFGYLGRRLWRPFDLLRRLGRYGARTVRLRLDGEVNIPKS